MSRFMQGDSVQLMATFPDSSIDFILTDPPYLVGFKDRSGRSIANDVNDDWVLPASRQMVSVLSRPSSISARVSYHGHYREKIRLTPEKARSPLHSICDSMTP